MAAPYLLKSTNLPKPTDSTDLSPVSQEGLQVGHKAIPWQNILSIEMEGEQIIVRLPDWEHWVGNSKAATPNVSVLKALIHYIGAEEKNQVGKDAHATPVFSHKRILARKRKHHRLT
jgi:hypothetical protein